MEEKKVVQKRYYKKKKNKIVRKRIIKRRMPNMTLLDKVYSDYKKNVNMNYSELKAWSKTKLSKEASLSRSPIKRNLELLKTPKEKWDFRLIKWALRTVRFIKRMKGVVPGKIVSHGLSKRDIALKNWGYNPRKRK